MAPIAKKKKKVKYTLSDLKTLGHQLLTSRVHINNLPLLLTFVSPTSHPQYVLESLLSLQSFFTPILADLPPSSTSKSSIRNGSNHDPEFIYRTWLRSKFDELVKLLIDVVVSPEPEDTLKEVALDSIMEFVKVGNGGRFHSAIYHKLLHNIVYCPTPTSVLVDLLTSKYFKYIDVRYFTYISLEKFARTLEAKYITDADGNGQSLLSSSMEHVTQNIYYVISHLPSLEGWDEISDFDMWSRSGLFSKESDLKELSEDVKAEDNQLKMKKKNNDISSAVHNIAKKMKLKFTKAWTSYLRLPLPLGVYKEVLVNLHQAVIPYFSNPILLCDFLTRSYDIGGVVSVMALSSLYLLMTQYGLEYPNFYEKLYALLVPSIFMAKHRAKFFQLLDSCLKSPLLPAYLAASFAKKLSRLSLSVSPSGALVIVALIHNLLRRHPSINCLVHREDGDEHGNDDPETEKVMVDTVNISGTSRDIESWKSCIDLFNNNETNPMKSSAMRSSLWEIDTLRHHYCPPVSRFVLSLENDLTIRAKTTEIAVKDFCSGSYATIFGEEMKRRVKQVPLAFYKATPTSLFSESEFAGWTFKYEDSLEIIGGSKEVTRNLCDHDNGSAKRQRIDSN
ncbi:nucleolar complex protein 4-like [Quillaja saponaria]|uniref:Nucleolar complex protein 4-like n=1 Tax=Quillaja saponaria TaxID=32244 RepID=A0AAD7M353_QUISA|nr:nucleolar complex protein 4-like [Quillaja saponaria]